MILQTVVIASGAAALGYAIVWGRWLATVLGASTLAASNRFNAYRAARRNWPTVGRPLPCRGPEVEEAQRFYQRAQALANRPKKKTRLELRLRQLEEQAPDCVETLGAALQP